MLDSFGVSLSFGAMGNAAHSAVPNVVYRFGLFVLDAGAGTLSRNGVRVKVQDQPFRLLLLLLQHAGQVVSREEIQNRLWPGNTYVEFDKSLGVAVLKVREALADEAGNPRFVETIPRRGYRFIAPVAVENLSEVRGAEKMDEAGRPSPTVSADRRAAAAAPAPGWPRWLWALPLVVLAAGFAVYKYAPRRSPAARVAPVQVHVRRSVAVLGFRNLPERPEDNWLSPAFAEMLSTDLAAGGELRMVSGEDVARAKSELPLSDEDTLAKSTLQRLRIDPGADVIVVGSYTVLANGGARDIRLDLRLQDTGSGETIAEDSVTGSENDLFTMVSEAGVRLRQRLGIAALPSTSTGAARTLLPRQPAIRFYTEGRARVWAFDFVGARDLLLKAVAADPDYPLSHAALSEAWDHLGYSAKAKTEAQRALSLSRDLPREQRLLIEGQYWNTVQDYPRAVAIYRSLFELFPDNLEYGLLLAAAQRWVAPRDSLETLAALRRLPFPTGDDPRIDLSEASSWINQDLAKAHAAAARAVAKGTAQGSHLLVARAYGVLCQQGSNIGSSAAEAFAACENARQSYAAAGDRNNEARTLSDYAGLYYLQGDLSRAEAMWRQAVPEFRQVGDVEAVAAVSNNLGDVFLMRGNLGEAEKFLEQAIPGYQAVQDKEGVALALSDLGDLRRQRGELQAALTSYRQAQATAKEIDDKNAGAYVLAGMGNVQLEQDNLEGARKSYEQSLAIREQAGQQQAAEETQTALAQVEIEEGHAARAEAEARQCERQFHQDQQADDELTASTVLMDALLAEGKKAEAQKEMEAEQALASKSQNSLLRLQFTLASARVLLASDRPQSSRPLLLQVVREAGAHGFAGLELESRLATADLDGRTEGPATEREQLRAVEKAAEAKGFGRISREAAAHLPEK